AARRDRRRLDRPAGGDVAGPGGATGDRTGPGPAEHRRGTGVAARCPGDRGHRGSRRRAPPFPAFDGGGNLTVKLTVITIAHDGERGDTRNRKGASWRLAKVHVPARWPAPYQWLGRGPGFGSPS